MSAQKKILFLLTGVMVAACQTNANIIPLPESEFRALSDFEIAQDISRHCPTLSLKKTRAQVDQEVDAIMISHGMTPEDIAAKKRIAATQWEPKYKAAYADVIPVSKDDPDYYCKYGQYEMNRRSAIGLLLT